MRNLGRYIQQTFAIISEFRGYTFDEFPRLTGILRNYLRFIVLILERYPREKISIFSRFHKVTSV